MTIPVSVVWPRSKGYWDHALLESAFDHRLWRPACSYNFEHHVNADNTPQEQWRWPSPVLNDGVVMVLPARHCTKDIPLLNARLSMYKWALVIATGDEEQEFRYEQLKHPNMKLWLMLPRPGVDKADRFLINGFPQGAQVHLPYYFDDAMKRSLYWFFAGQVTHRRREECVAELEKMQGGKLVKTAGFTQGMAWPDYYRYFAASKFAPCPSGARMPDSFRVAEALEAGCIPIADATSPIDGYPDGYWTNVFGEEPPFPVVKDWRQMHDLFRQLDSEWPHNQSRVFSWWQNYCRKMAYWLRDDIAALRKEKPMAQTFEDQLTVLIPTSPIPSHPDCFKIEQCIAGVRHHFPNAEILILFDGPRPSVMHRRGQYEEYKQRMLWKCKNQFRNVLPVVFEQHVHQSGMLRHALDNLVKTELILFAEHDAPIRTDRVIDWYAINQTLLAREANYIRLYYFEELIPEHAHLFHGMRNYHGANFMTTTQFSGWPHVARVDWWKEMLNAHFPFRGAECMIETAMYSPICSAKWEASRGMIYHPDGPLSRFVHTNGRGEGAERDPTEW
jgi:hypothetical protein